MEKMGIFILKCEISGTKKEFLKIQFSPKKKEICNFWFVLISSFVIIKVRDFSVGVLIFQQTEMRKMKNILKYEISETNFLKYNFLQKRKKFIINFNSFVIIKVRDSFPFCIWIHGKNSLAKQKWGRWRIFLWNMKFLKQEDSQKTISSFSFSLPF